VPVEAIALLAGHNQTATTELVYRHQIVPVLTRGAEIMDQIFGLTDPARRQLRPEAIGSVRGR
jgi:hypothetical protein